MNKSFKGNAPTYLIFCSSIASSDLSGWHKDGISILCFSPGTPSSFHWIPHIHLLNSQTGTHTPMTEVAMQDQQTLQKQYLEALGIWLKGTLTWCHIFSQAPLCYQAPARGHDYLTWWLSTCQHSQTCQHLQTSECKKIKNINLCHNTLNLDSLLRFKLN